MQIKIDNIKYNDIKSITVGGIIVIDGINYDVVEKTEDYVKHRFASSTRYVLEDTLTNDFWELIVDYDTLGDIFLDGFTYSDKVLTELERIEFTQHIYRYKTT